MALRKIARMGHPLLGRRAETVADPCAPAVRALIEDMVETMVDAEGLGIAAPQVHDAKRVVMFFVPTAAEGEAAGQRGASDDGDDGVEAGRRELVILINPVVEPLTTEREVGWEGCLSVPGLRGLVARPRAVRYRGVAPDGSAVERSAEGLHARVVQHECDHLDGILYPQRMDDLSSLTFESEWRRFAGARRTGEAG